MRTKILSSLLSAWIAKYRWLSHKTPPGGASSCCARYLLTQKNSQSGGHLLLTNKTNQGQPMMNNVEAHVVSTTIRNIITSAAEAKIAALYLNTKENVIIRNTLEETVHPQPATPHTYQQLKIISNSQHNYCPKILQSHRHAFLLAAWSGEPKTLSSLLSTLITKYRWLSHKTPPGGALHRKTKKIQNPGIQRVCVDPEGTRTSHAAAFLLKH